MTPKRWAAVAATVLASVGLVVAAANAPTPKAALHTGALPGLLPTSAAYVVSCVAPGVIAYQGTVAETAGWVSIPPQAGACWTTYYVTPSATTTTTTTAPPTTTTTTTRPVTTTTLFSWPKYCAAHPTYYNPKLCPLNHPPTTTTTPTTIPAGAAGP